MELFANNDTTTLNGSITSGATTLVVVSATPFPASGNFRILIDSELMLVTGVSGTTFTVSRGAEGTAAASHSLGATVAGVLTAAALAQFRADSVDVDTYANQPAAGNSGRLFLPNNSFYLQHDNGSTWDSYGPLYPMTPPSLGSYSWANQGLATIVTTKGGSYLSAPGNAGVDTLNMQVKAVATAPYTYVVGFVPLLFSVNYSNAGVCLYDGTKVITFGLVGDQVSNTSPDCYYQLNKWTNSSTFSASYNFLHGAHSLGMLGTIAAPCHWLAIVDDGTTRHWKVSADGQNFIEVANQSNTDFLTPTKIGFYVDPAGASIATGMTILSIVG